MRSVLFKRAIYLIVPLFGALFLVGGCARTPVGSSANTVRGLGFQISFNGPINDNYYYYVAIDTQGLGQGPLPVFTNPEVSSGDDWVTGSANYYVQYHQRQYTVFRIDRLNPLQATPIGTPVRAVYPDPGGNNLNFTVDLDSISATGSSVDVNIIALNQLAPEGRLLDALGPLGNDFVNVDIGATRTYRNAETTRPEGTDDVLNQNANPVQPAEAIKPIDILDWTITTNI
jgi:hypothetical protein